MKHGTSTGYCRHKCRCYDCTKAQREYLRKYRATSEGAIKTRLNNKLSGIRQQLAADWLRENQPDVWAAIFQMAELHPSFIKFKESQNAGRD